MLETAISCKQCGARIAPPADVTTTSVTCDHCGTSQLVPDAVKRLALADQLADRRADQAASRHFDRWLYAVIIVFIVALLAGVTWFTIRKLRSATDPGVATGDVADWIAAQHGCRAITGPSALVGPAKLRLATTGCTRVRLRAGSDAFPVRAQLATTSGAIVAGPSAGTEVDLRACSGETALDLVIDANQVAHYAAAAVACP